MRNGADSAVRDRAHDSGSIHAENAGRMRADRAARDRAARIRPERELVRGIDLH